MPITDDSRVAEELREKYAEKGLDEGIITDTILNTGLLLKVRNQYYPVRCCAIKSILDRAGISGAGLRRVEKNVYARILNDCLKVAKGEALLRISECKTTNYNCQNKWSNDSLPVNYEYQVRHYMAVLNLDRAMIACLYGNNETEFFIRCVERDLDIEEDLIAEEEYFWKENVEKAVEPPYTEKPDLVLESIRRHCGPAEKDADQVKLDRKHILSLERYLKLKEEKAQHEGEAKKLDGLMKEACAGIVEEMGVSCSGVLKDGPVAVSGQPSGDPRDHAEKAGCHHGLLSGKPDSP